MFQLVREKPRHSPGSFSMGSGDEERSVLELLQRLEEKSTGQDAVVSGVEELLTNCAKILSTLTGRSGTDEPSVLVDPSVPNNEVPVKEKEDVATRIKEVVIKPVDPRAALQIMEQYISRNLVDDGLGVLPLVAAKKKEELKNNTTPSNQGGIAGKDRQVGDEVLPGPKSKPICSCCSVQ